MGPGSENDAMDNSDQMDIWEHTVAEGDESKKKNVP